MFCNFQRNVDDKCLAKKLIDLKTQLKYAYCLLYQIKSV